MAGRRRLGAFRALAGNGALRRVVGGYALFILTEYSVWIAMLVYAYGRGGATIAGVVALAQLVPAALLAPVFAALADRRSPVVLLAGGYLVQAAAMGATAVAITGGMPLAAYAAAVVASTAVTATRPAQSTLIPSLAVTPDQLTAANVVMSWVEAAGIVAATVSVVLVGRRLGGPIVGSALLLSGALAALVADLGLRGTVALLTVAGAGRALLDVASRSLLQRSVPAQSLGQVFGLLEGLTMAGLAIGSVLVPVLVHLGGTRLAMLGVAAVLPLAAAAGGRALFPLDAQAPVPVVQIALLRSLPLFAELPAPALEGLAAALTPAEVPAGAVLIRQGEEGDAYYAIAAGQVDDFHDGRFVRRCGRGEGVGEIALLRAVPRTASVVAQTGGTVYRLAREPFLTAVLGHAATQRQAHSIVDAQLATDATRGNDPGAADAADLG